MALLNSRKKTTFFNNMSLYKKIVLIVFASLLCIYLVFFFNIQFLSRQYEKELYRSNAQALSHVSAAITAELQAVESISTNLLSDSIIQDNLYYLKDSSYPNRIARAKKDIYNSLYSYTFYNSYIKSINIVLNDKSNICMGNGDDILNFDLEKLEDKSEDFEGKLGWEPGLFAGTDVVCFRQFRQQKYLTFDKLADLYIVIDMEKLIQDSLKISGYFLEDADFVLLNEDHRIYPASPTYDQLCNSLLNNQEESYHITSIDGNEEFIITGTIPFVNWHYFYFRDYAPLFQNIQSAKMQVLVFTICFSFLALLVVQILFKSILKHLDFLIEKIQSFGNGKQPAKHPQTYDYQTRQDEIGQLHRNFDEMTKSVKVLRDENYEKQLLLRDSTIKMLQQQINPHFLYNTLDTINWMAQKHEVNEISIMARSLGNLFRSSINGQDDIIPLSEELTVLDNYICIQQIRFRDRLVFQCHLPKHISHILVPKLCIQPLVENALKHSLEHTVDLCTVQVVISEHKQYCSIKVTNTGSRFEKDLLEKLVQKQITPSGSGVGLLNINSRLQLLYGEQFGLNFYNDEDNDMAIVVMSIPQNRRV